MLKFGSIESASESVLKDARRLIDSLRRHVVNELTTVAEAIKSLNHIREETYESLNQIQHEYLIIQASKWLQINDPTLIDASWLWNPRQTGTYDEPDFAVVRQKVRFISEEITTSTEPKGLIDSRMRDTLEKLNLMQGKKYYFVPTEKMRRRADTEISKNGWDITPVVIKGE